MRYVPNLIPDNRKVLKDYFKGSIYGPGKQNSLLTVGGWIAGIIFLLWSFPTLICPPLSLILFLLGVSFLPPGHRLIERTFRFRWTTKVKTIVCGILLVMVIPLGMVYARIADRLIAQETAKEQQEHQAKIAADQKAAQRRDSLNARIQRAVMFEKADRLDEAGTQLRLAQTCAATAEDTGLIEKTDTDIIILHAYDLVRAGAYTQALPQLTTLVELHPGNADLRYNRALCYSGIGQIPDAVRDCDTAAMLGDSAAAEALNDKINPVKKRVAYYTTRCCDGSSSDATGSGACSHHGGVCEWHSPVYEESRKYE